MDNGHSAIDSLIALTTLKRYQEGGEVQPTMGQRFIQRFPSQHEDAMRAAEQERPAVLPELAASVRGSA